MEDTEKDTVTAKLAMLPCPHCGGPVTFPDGVIVPTVCEHCKHDVDVSGKEGGAESSP